MTCADCGRNHWLMVVLRSPTGPWALCSSCMRTSLREAEEDRKEREALVENMARKERKTHLKQKVGSHG